MGTAALNEYLGSAVFALTDRELWVVTAQANSRQGGLIATFVSRASIVPTLPRVMVSIAKQHCTWELVEESGAFALHLICEQHVDWVWRFGLQCGRDADKLEGLSKTYGPTGSPLLTDALASLDCCVEARLDCGDRTVYLAEIVTEAVLREGKPLTFTRLLEIAPADERRHLAEHMERDAEIDAQKIQAWRRKTRGGTGSYTRRQGQSLAFIYYYTKIHGEPPAESDIAQHFRITPPAAHQMVVTLERLRFIERQRGVPRSISLRITREELPHLD